jgi:hypothetical protein
MGESERKKLPTCIVVATVEPAMAARGGPLAFNLDHVVLAELEMPSVAAVDAQLKTRAGRRLRPATSGACAGSSCCTCEAEAPQA